MKIKINDIESYRSPESISIELDDRIEKIELINGNCVEDYGYIPSGDRVSVTALFRRADVEAIAALWMAREKVTFTDDSGSIWNDMRIVVRRYQYYGKFPDYIMLEFELWRI